MTTRSLHEDLWRREAPQVLLALVRRYGHFPLAEEAVQDALLEAATAWAGELPVNPRGWLIRVAQRSLIDSMRSEYSRTAREERYSRAEPLQAVPLEATTPRQDDSLDLLFLCCHPSLSPSSAVALTLRAVGGLTTDEIAAAFFVPSATMGQRISRAKKTVAGVRIDLDTSRDDFPSRLDAVLTVLYLMFNEGYTSSGGDHLTRVDLSAEAIRLTRSLHAQFATHVEISALLALQLLHEARRATRERDGMPTPLNEQDRLRWDGPLIAEGTRLVDEAMALGPVGPYQLQAAIAALHCAAATPEDTDWRQILALYDLLTQIRPSPMLSVSRAVAVARVHGARAGLTALNIADQSPQLAHSHRVVAVKGHLLKELGDPDGAATAFRHAAKLTRSQPEKRYLLAQLAQIEAPTLETSPKPGGEVESRHWATRTRSAPRG